LPAKRRGEEYLAATDAAQALPSDGEGGEALEAGFGVALKRGRNHP
jgi:hypothetical protein